MRLLILFFFFLKLNWRVLGPITGNQHCTAIQKISYFKCFSLVKARDHFLRLSLRVLHTYKLGLTWECLASASWQKEMSRMLCSVSITIAIIRVILLSKVEFALQVPYISHVINNYYRLVLPGLRMSQSLATKFFFEASKTHFSISHRTPLGN